MNRPTASPPRVSIGLPVFNGNNYIAASIESILGQTFGDFELVIVDNASTDGTEATCQRYSAADARVRYIRNPVNIGAAANFNATFRLSRAPYFKWVAHDDVHAPTYLEETVRILDENPDCILAHSEVDIIDSAGQVLRSHNSDILDMAHARAARRFGDLADLKHWCFDVFGLIRSSALASTPLIAAYIGSDRNLLAELALMGKFHRVPKRLFRSRDHDDRSVRSTSYRDRGAWFAPSLAGKLAFPHWRHLYEYLRSVHRVPLGYMDRLGCYRELISWAFHWRRHLSGDVRHAVRVKMNRAVHRESS